ncbi:MULTISPECIES: crotonase/enoyl-CoA hydratase family protein [Psychrobacter]|jgi:enoyl-CoA hydratase/carnithine racemase|uniref:Crotonase/enoyl-CoA hydratase family protein n=1 Tax=Psychrobacter sanguinis TaxID=861445 RepID=A0A844LXM3_9GAMM|nr:MULTISPECIES: crotonase/enoyl-CoA hydratase family protein [Psychrobacter]MUG31442.1 crotonase/enoyl-CoA hydratase family protein [Psychrobacter sanguinis]
MSSLFSQKLNEKYTTLALSEADEVLTVSLNRPDKKNAMSLRMMRELIDVAERLKKDRSIRSVIINGAGDSFCAGIDLSDLNNPKNAMMGLYELLKPTQSIFQRVCLIWREVPVPVIVVTQGYCIGAGMQLALACDFRISTPDCQFAIMEAKWGLVPDMGLTQSALHVLPVDVLKELTMTARLIDAKQAEQLHLVTHIDDTPYERAQALATEIATRSPDAVLASKRVINQMTKQSFCALYQEKMWQLKLMGGGKNRKLAIKKAKDNSVQFLKRQFS